MRIGIVGTDNTHAHTFAALINGWDGQVPFLPRQPEGPPVPDAEVTRIWSADRTEGERIARAADIEHVCETPAEACEDVDAVCVLSESPAEHAAHALPALERGLPTFVDKPMAEGPDEARAIFATAERHGALCWTTSGKRYDRDVSELRDRALAAWGRIAAATIVCPLSVELYGIHAIEIAAQLLGLDIVAVDAIRLGNRTVAGLEYASGATATLENLELVRHPRYEVRLYGPGGELLAGEANDSAANLRRLVEDILAAARSGRAPVTSAESLRRLELLRDIRATCG